MSVKIDYGDGVTVEVEPGTSVLEASLFRDRLLNAIGDAINLVSRLEDFNRELDTSILLTQDVVDACSEIPGLGRRFSLNVRGRSTPVTAWELLEPAAE